MKHEEPDYLPGEAAPGTGLLSIRYILLGILVGRYRGTITFYNQMHLTQHELSQMGYPVCEDVL